MEFEDTNLTRKKANSRLRRALLFAGAGLAAALLVGIVYLGYGLYLFLTCQTGFGCQPSSQNSSATATEIHPEALVASSAATEQAADSQQGSSTVEGTAPDLRDAQHAETIVPRETGLPLAQLLPMPTDTAAPPTPLPTARSIPPTPVPSATVNRVPAAPTATAIPPVPTPTATLIPPTATPTATAVPPTLELTSTRLPIDATATPEPTPTPEIEPTVVGPTAEPTVAAEYFESHVEPCMTEPSAADPCDTGQEIRFQGLIPVSVSLPDRPPSLEELLFNSWRDQDLADVSYTELLSATHIVARGRFAADSLACEGFPVRNPGWSVDFADFGIPEPGPGENVFLEFGIYHWMCFARLKVHEYMVGIGGASITVGLAAASIPYFDKTEIETSQSREILASYQESIADHFVGREWVVWLAPSYTTAVESWTAYSLWDVQRAEDGIVRVVSEVAEHYEKMGDSEHDHSHLKVPLVEFRQLIADANSDRLARTSGRIGVGADTPMLVQDAFRLSDYYREIGAYDYPAEYQPKPAPTAQ